MGGAIIKRILWICSEIGAAVWSCYFFNNNFGNKFAFAKTVGYHAPVVVV